MSKRSSVLWICLLIFAATTPAGAHNNPKFIQVLLHTVTIGPDGSGADATEPFVLELPRHAAELIWKVAGDAPDQVRFSLLVDGDVVAADLQTGARSKLFRNKEFSIVDVKGTLPVVIEVYASVIDRSGQNAAHQPPG